jgi:hypothetical protein
MARPSTPERCTVQSELLLQLREIKAVADARSERKFDELELSPSTVGSVWHNAGSKVESGGPLRWKPARPNRPAAGGITRDARPPAQPLGLVLFRSGGRA